VGRHCVIDIRSSNDKYPTKPKSFWKVKVNVKEVSEESHISDFLFADGKEYILEYSKEVHEQCSCERDASKNHASCFLLYLGVKLISKLCFKISDIILIIRKYT